MRHFLPYLNRDSIFCILKAEVLNRRVKPSSHQLAKGEGTLKGLRARPHVLTDNCSCFTRPLPAPAPSRRPVSPRHTKPRPPRTIGMVEHFNGRVGTEMLEINICTNRDLEQLLRGFNAVYDDRCQRVLNGKTPNQIVAELLKARRKLIRGEPEGRAGSDNIFKACLIAEDAKQVSQPDSRCSSKD